MQTKLTSRMAPVKGAIFASAMMLFSSHAHANPISIHFLGADYGGPSLFNGASNELNLSHGQAVSGSFEIDTTELTDTNPAPNKLFFPNAIRSFTFNGISVGNGEIDYSYYYFEPENISFYVNDIHENVSDVYILNIKILPGVFYPDFDLATFKLADIDSASIGSSQGASIWLFQRANLLEQPTPVVVYSGWINSVAVTAIPEPAILPIMLFGLSLLGVIGRRRPQKQANP